MTVVDEGKKFDDGKLPFHLLPMDALGEVVRVLQFGATKYGDRNWELGMSWSRLVSATWRHVFWKWWQGENYDDETKINHLAHAICCLLFLLAYQLRNVGEDDRPIVRKTT